MREPTREDLGAHAEWELEEAEQILAVEGDLIGWASTQRPDHSHPDEEDPPPRVQCRACRWFEIRIVDIGGGSYVVHRIGKSIVEGESSLHTPTVIAKSAGEVLAALLQDGSLSGPAKGALTTAAGYDDAIFDVSQPLLHPEKQVRRLQRDGLS